MQTRNILAAAAASLAILLMPLWCRASVSPNLNETAHSAERERSFAPALPFSFEEVLSYFQDSLGKLPNKVHNKSYAFIENENSDEAVIIFLSAVEPTITVVLVTTGDFGVNYIREFFEAPFFLRSETEQLYALMDAGLGTRSIELGRFGVEVGVLETHAWIIIAVEFSPPGAYRPELGFRPE